MSDKWHGGKGSKRRPEDRKAYEDNYDKIFGKKDKDKKDSDTVDGTLYDRGERW